MKNIQISKTRRKEALDSVNHKWTKSKRTEWKIYRCEEMLYKSIKESYEIGAIYLDVTIAEVHEENKNFYKYGFQEFYHYIYSEEGKWLDMYIHLDDIKDELRNRIKDSTWISDFEYILLFRE